MRSECWGHIFSGTHESRAGKKGALNNDPLCGAEKMAPFSPCRERMGFRLHSLSSPSSLYQHIQDDRLERLCTVYRHALTRKREREPIFYLTCAFWVWRFSSQRAPATRSM